MPSLPKKKSDWIALLIALPIAFLLIRSRLGQHDDVEQKVRDVVEAVCADVPDPEYVEKLIDEHHGAAFSRSFDPGGRRRAASFDQERYHFDLFFAMKDAAISDGRADVGQALGDAHMRLAFALAAEGDG